ncbi:MAG: OmpA family protein [Bacteroidota bacterium]
MIITSRFILFILVGLSLSSCISKSQYEALQQELSSAEAALANSGDDLANCMSSLASAQRENDRLKGSLQGAQDNVRLREEQISDLRDQINDFRNTRDAQINQVEGLTQLSQSAQQNIEKTLGQLEERDDYIKYLMSAKDRADSINLALGVNLTRVLQKGIADDDIEVKVDKTVVFINLSDKVLYESGKSTLSSRANEVLGKIATIIKSRPNLEVMVEGYTDNVPINSDCVEDNWALSVRRATSVVRSLQNEHEVDPNRLIAAGRGEYNTLASNDTPEGRATNRRTRIILLPKLNEFYDLLDPDQAPE